MRLHLHLTAILFSLILLTIPAVCMAQGWPGQTPPPQQPTAQDPLAGTWQGTARDPADDGSVAEYPLMITITSSGSGGYTAQVESRIEAADESGRPLTIIYGGVFAGNAANGQLQMQSTKVELRIVEANQIIPISNHRLMAQLQGNQLTGQMGNDQDGWMQITATRRNAPQGPESGPITTPGSGDRPMVTPPQPNQLDGLGFNPQQAQLPLSPFVSHIPGAADVKPPAWCKPGVRITIWSGTATVIDQANQSTVSEDPNGPYLDPKTGKRYRESQMPGGSAAVGFNVIDIVAADDDAVVMQISAYLNDGSTEAPKRMDRRSVIVHPSGHDSFWVHPDLLRKLVERNEASMTTMDVNGQQRQAVFMLHARNNHNVFDAETGISLRTLIVTQGGAGEANFFNPATGKYEQRAGSGSTRIVNVFRSIRETYVGQMAQFTFPESIQQIKGIRVKLQQIVRDTEFGTPDQVQINVMANIEVLASNKDGMVIRMNMQQGNQSSPHGQQNAIVLPVAPGEIAGAFKSPAFLAQLQQGQVLDEDPLTGYRTFVEFVGAAQDGRRIVAISEVGAMTKTTTVYDAQSGIGISSQTTDAIGSMQTILTSQLVEVW